MRIGIIGSERAKFTPIMKKEAFRIIKDILSRRKNPTVISGGCHLGGVDKWAEMVAEEMGLKCIVHKPRNQKWSTGYRPRNVKIAKDSQHVHIIVPDKYIDSFTDQRFPYCYHCNSTTHVKSGACWTGKEALRRGKKVFWHVVQKEPKMAIVHKKAPKAAEQVDVHKTRLSKVRKKLKEMGSSNQFMKLESEKKYLVRILPPWGKEADGAFFFSSGLHYGFQIGGQDRAIYCLEFKNEECPVCQFIQALKDKKPHVDEDLAEQFSHLIGEIKRGYKNYMNVALIGNDGKPTGEVKILSLSKAKLDEIVEAMDDDDIGDITDIETGHNVKVGKTGTGKYGTKYKVRVMPTPSALELEDWKSKVHKLHELAEYMNPAEIRATVKANYGEYVEEVEDDLNWPKSAKKNKLKKSEDVDEEEDDKPSKKLKKHKSPNGTPQSKGKLKLVSKKKKVTATAEEDDDNMDELLGDED